MGLALSISAIKIPFKDDVINDLHDLLLNQNFIGKSTLPNWESQIKLKLKSLIRMSLKFASGLKT